MIQGDQAPEAQGCQPACTEGVLLQNGKAGTQYPDPAGRGNEEWTVCAWGVPGGTRLAARWRSAHGVGRVAACMWVWRLHGAIISGTIRAPPYTGLGRLGPLSASRHREGRKHAAAQAHRVRATRPSAGRVGTGQGDGCPDGDGPLEDSSLPPKLPPSSDPDS